MKVPDKYEEVKQHILAIFKDHKGRYGYRRITCLLKNMGFNINHKTVQKLMTMLNLKSTIRRKKYQCYRGTIGSIAPNILQRHFTAESPNEKWVTDITEFNVLGEKLYLSPIVDLYNGEIIAYEIAKKPLFDMVRNMLKKAFKKLGAQERPLLHSDQGWQYQMALYRQLLDKYGIQQSMSRKGNCLDNAVIENFFSHIKSELFYQERFTSIEQLWEALENYLYYYNHKRIKQKLNGLSPVQYRIQTSK